MKNLVVFDLDGTLAESKASIDVEMANLLNFLLSIVKVAVISGAAWRQFEQQVLAHLSRGEGLKNLSVLPTCGTKFYQYDFGWEQLYSEDFTETEKTKIISSLKRVLGSSDHQVEKVWGEVIEDRGSQITFSALQKRGNGIPISPSASSSKQSSIRSSRSFPCAWEARLPWMLQSRVSTKPMAFGNSGTFFTSPSIR